MNYQKFEDLRVWQSARELYKVTSDALENVRCFSFEIKS